jgi:hypothetical protein
MKQITFLISEERGLQLLDYFNRHYPNICNVEYQEEHITFWFNELYEELVIQGIFHAGLSIGMDIITSKV